MPTIAIRHYGVKFCYLSRTSDHTITQIIFTVLDLTKEVNMLLFVCSEAVESKLAKRETSHTVILSPTVRVLWINSFQNFRQICFPVFKLEGFFVPEVHCSSKSTNRNEAIVLHEMQLHIERLVFH